MQKYGLINCIWDNNVTDGLDAMFSSWQEYNNLDSIEKSNKFKNIIKYNEVDCKTMFEILQYLKTNH